MSGFLDSLRDELETIEQRIEALPGDIDSVVSHLEWTKLRTFFLGLNQDYRKLLQDEQRLYQGVLLGRLLITTDRAMAEQMSNLIKTFIPDVRVVLGKGQVKAMAISNLARENKMTASDIILSLREEGYLVLGWDEYRKLLDEIGKLLAQPKEGGTLTEPLIRAIPLPVILLKFPQLRF